MLVCGRGQDEGDGIPPAPGRGLPGSRRRWDSLGPGLLVGLGPGRLREGRCARRSPWSLSLMVFWLAGQEEVRPQANRRVPLWGHQCTERKDSKH